MIELILFGYIFVIVCAVLIKLLGLLLKISVAIFTIIYHILRQLYEILKFKK
jgi:hypothetical protein